MEQIFLIFCVAWTISSTMALQDYYNVLTSKDFGTFKGCSVPCAVHFLTTPPDKLGKDWRMKEFMTNFEDSGRYLVDFDVKFATIDCTVDPVTEFCSKDTAKRTLFIFRFGSILTELPMDALYNVDAIVSNMLHLVLLRDVPLIQEPTDLASVQQRLKGRKDIIFGKLLAVGTSGHRAFVEGAFAYSHQYQFVMTTNMVNNMLGPGDLTYMYSDEMWYMYSLEDEWKEAVNRVWLLSCKQAAMTESCQRSFYRGKLTVPNFALYLKTLDLLPFMEYKSSGSTIFYQKLGIPTAYLYSNTEDYARLKWIVENLAQTFRGNLGFVLVNSDNTPESVVADKDRCKPPCFMLQRAPQEDLIQMGAFLTVTTVSNFIQDNMYVVEEELDDQEGDSVPVQEVQDDEVQYAVFRDTRILDTTNVEKLTDKTFQEFIASTDLHIVLFTVRWDPRCKAFLEPYSLAANTLQKEVSTGRPGGISPLAQVECFNWPDVCQLSNVTTYPTIKMFRDGGLVADYEGALSQEGILKAYRLYSTANPLVLSTCTECQTFSRGQFPSWAATSLGAVVMAYFPTTGSHGRAEYEQAAKMLRGQQLLGICQTVCGIHGSDTSKPTVTAYKWGDEYQPMVQYTGDYTIADLIQFVHSATLPLVPELTPSTFPVHFGKGKPFLILFKDTDSQSKEAEASLVSLAQEKTFDNEIIILWIDVSQPSCIGSKILQDYGINRQPLHPSLVFVDHRTSRVCNYPPDYSLKASSVADWVFIVLNGETTCTGLREGKFEPQVSAYDFLSFIKANKVKLAEKMGRIPTNHYMEGDGDGEEEEAKGEEGEMNQEKEPWHEMGEHLHTEL